MTNRFFCPVGGTGSGPVDKPYDIALWHEIIKAVLSTPEPINIGLLVTPSRLSGTVDIDVLVRNHQALGRKLNCSFTLLDDEMFSAGEYDDKFDVLCITCGDTQGARDSWRNNNCEERIRSWYQKGVLVTGYSAGFILFYEWASTDSVPGPDGAIYGVMPCMGIIKGAAVPHVDTQQERIGDFQKVLKDQPISPVIALGEDTMAIYKNEHLESVKASSGSAMAGWVEIDNFSKIPIKRI